MTALKFNDVKNDLTLWSDMTALAENKLEYVTGPKSAISDLNNCLVAIQSGARKTPSFHWIMNVNANPNNPNEMKPSQY